jgi:hypothetical protein
VLPAGRIAVAFVQGSASDLTLRCPYIDILTNGNGRTSGADQPEPNERNQFSTALPSTRDYRQCSGRGSSLSTFHVILDGMLKRNDCYREHVLRFPVVGRF